MDMHLYLDLKKSSEKLKNIWKEKKPKKGQNANDQKGLSANDIANYLGLNSVSDVYRLFNRAAFSKIEYLYELSCILDTDIEDFIVTKERVHEEETER